MLRHLLVVALLCSFVIAGYSNALEGEFVFDDHKSIPNNKSIETLFSWKIFQPPGAGRTVGGRPMLNVSFAINRALAGKEIQAYRATNIGIHLVNVVLIYSLVLRLSRLDQDRYRLTKTERTMLAMGSALLFGIHPIQTEAVTYTVQRAESLAVCFLLLAWRFHVRFLDTRGWFSAVMVVLASVAGYATKEIVFVLPAVLLLTEMLVRQRGVWIALRNNWRYWLALLCCWGIMLLIVVKMDGRGSTAGLGAMHRFKEYTSSQLVYLPHYVRLIFLPDSLTADYGFPIFLAWWKILLGTIALLGLLYTAWRLCWLSQTACLLIVAGILTLLPSSSLIPVSTQVAAEHRMYLTLAAFAFLVSLGIVIAVRRIVLHDFSRTLSAAMLLLTIGAMLAWATYRRNEVYHSKSRFWTDVRNKAPYNYRGYYNLARIHRDQGEHEEAIRRYQDLVDRFATEKRSEHFVAWSHREIGKLRQSRGEHSLAIKHFRDAIAVLDTEKDLYLRLSGLLADSEPEEAVRVLESGLEKLDENEEIKQRLESLRSRG